MRTLRRLTVLLGLLGLSLSAQVIEPDRTVQDHIAYAATPWFDAVRNSVFRVVATWTDGAVKQFNGFYLRMWNQVGLVSCAHGFNHDIAKVQLYFGPDSANPSRVVDVSSWLMHPGYGATVGDVNDIGLMTPSDWSLLSSLTPIPMYSGSLAIGDSLYTIG